jgi:glycosyltransferase involved in cell wall biosynthesis
VIGGAEYAALGLADLLGRSADVHLWATDQPHRVFLEHHAISRIDPGAGIYPVSGTFVIAGAYLELDDWIEQTRPERTVVCQTGVDIEVLTRFLASYSHLVDGGVSLSYPSQLVRREVGQRGLVEYPQIDTSRFRPRARKARTGAFVVGRHSRDTPDKHHPNDPAMYRQLIARSHRIRVMGGTCLEPAFHGDEFRTGIDLLPVNALAPDEFLATLDCFIYRTRPHIREAFGMVIAEAMAMALPVVVFSGPGATELIESGTNGFVVESEAEALRTVNLLADSPELRRQVGDAARRTIIDAMNAQEGEIVRFYLNPELSACA